MPGQPAAERDGGAGGGAGGGCDYDVVVIGGSVSGSSVATLVKQWHPEARILIVERAERFGRKVGEATVEVSGLFLSRVLGLYDELSRHHLPKHGLRWWFCDNPDDTLFSMSEVGPNRLPTLASFQLDRARLDEHLLHRVADAGVEVARPAQVKDVTLDWPRSVVRLIDADGEREVSCRWVLDATGRAGLLSKRLGLRQPNAAHPTSAAWARWDGVKDMDGTSVTGPTDGRLPKVFPSRRLATNHFNGPGWWCWVIPLAGGQTSIGVVYDQRLFDLPGTGKAAERYESFVRSQPGLRELLAGATIEAADFTAYQHLSYACTKYADRGWALIGDAAAFLDPLYSPGLDNVAFTAYASASIIRDDLMGKLDDAALDQRLTTHNRRFTRSYRRWMRGIYLDKYHLFGDPELVTAAYCFDIGMYYQGVVAAAYRETDNLTVPPLGVDVLPARLAYGVLFAVKAWMVSLARRRRRAGFRSERLSGWRYFPTSFELGTPAGKLILTGIWIVLKAELRTQRWRLGRLLRGRGKQPAISDEQTPPVATPTVPPAADMR